MKSQLTINEAALKEIEARPDTRGGKIPNRDIRQILEEAMRGVPYYTIASRYNVSDASIGMRLAKVGYFRRPGSNNSNKHQKNIDTQKTTQQPPVQQKPRTQQAEVRYDADGKREVWVRLE